MLRTLSVQNIAIAENLTVDFSSGLNVITGETGAGKSILVDALGLLRNQKVDLSLIRIGSDNAQVSAVFQIKKDSSIFETLEELGIGSLDEGREIVLRKLINRQSKHRAFINDVPVNLKTLQLVATDLIDISSQYENQHLLVPSHHTTYLDQFANCSAISVMVSKNVTVLNDLCAEINELDDEIKKHERECALYQFELNQIVEANVVESKWDEVQRIVSIGNKSAQASQICFDVMNMLTDTDDSCAARLKQSIKQIERLAKLAPNSSFPVDVENFRTALAGIEELSYQTQKTQQFFFIDESDLQAALERAEVYNKILSRFGPSIADVLNHKSTCEQSLNAGLNLSEKRDSLIATAAKLLVQTIQLAKKLSKARQESVKPLCARVEAELSELGMGKTKFVCELRQSEPASLSDKWPEIVLAELDDGHKKLANQLLKSGFERAQFLMSANMGFEPQAIEKVASGGELSRVMLAIKNVLFAKTPLSVFVFDEIDTGVSGQIAAKIGRKLAEFCRKRQAVCITHLPQVACFADEHLIAKKVTRANTTVATVKQASETERIEELAKMLSGERRTTESLAQAKRLVAEARRV